MPNKSKFDKFVAAIAGSSDDEEEAVSSLQSPYDALALAVHVWALENDLQLIAVNDITCVSKTQPVINTSSSRDGVQLMQTKWTQCSPNYYNFRYTYGPEIENDYNSKQELGNHVATLDFTITKLGHRDVQVTLTGTISGEFDKDKHGSLQSLQNEGEKNSNSDDLENVNLHIALNSVVDTHFFVNQPRESENMVDVYKSNEAVSQFWKSLDETMDSTIQIVKSKVSNFKDSKVDDTSNKDSEGEDSDISKERKNQHLDARNSELGQINAAAESSPSPAARGPGTPFTPYGTPPPFAHQRRNFNSQLNSDNQSNEEFNDSDSQMDKRNEVVSNNAKATRKSLASNHSSSLTEDPLPNINDVAPESSHKPLTPVGGDIPPGFEDEYEMRSALQNLNEPGGRTSLLHQPLPSAGGFGDPDLYPPGFNPHQGVDALGRPIGLGNGNNGPSPYASGGMHPTFDDIQRMTGGGRFPNNLEDDDPTRPGFLEGRPPGARWDPTGPFGGPGRGSGGGGSFGGGFNRFF